MADSSTLPCERCTGPTVEIALLEGEHRLVMRSCSRCDHRVWLRDDEPTAMTEVLQTVASTGRRRSA